MTGLINSLVGVASTAVERFTGSLGSSAGANREGGGDFASVLANLAGGAPTASNPTAAPTAALLQLPLLLVGSAAKGAPGSAMESDAELAAEGDAELDADAGEGAAMAHGDEEVAAPADGDEVAALAQGGVELAAMAHAGVGSTAAVDVRRVDRNLERLDPVFRGRLERVMERMEAEFGHEVRVVEGHRSQERQNHLYEQGRSRPGPVVTWTRNSNHTRGRAVDVMIDGTYDNRAGYERLAKIAAEEGLRTLGARDPGHVELPRDVRGGGMPSVFAAAQPGRGPAAAQSARRSATAEARQARPGEIARVAEVARVAQPGQVAQVAQVAQLARVAEVARVGGGRTGQGAGVVESSPAGTPSRVPVPGDPAPLPGPQNMESAAALLGSRLGQSGGDRNGGSEGRREGQREAGLTSTQQSQLLGADAGFGRTLASTPVAEPRLGAGTDAVQRAAQILAMKEGAAAGPVNHLLLRVDAPGGGEDRIRVDLRGSSIDATLNIENATEAERLSSRVSELRQSLGRHGLEAETVRVRTTQLGGAERLDTSRAALAAAELETSRGSGQSRTGSESSTGREGWKETHGQSRREPGDPRQRSRREPQQESKS